MSQLSIDKREMRKDSRLSAQDAFVALGGRIAKITNISRGGLSFEYVSDNNRKEQACELDIFLSENEFHVPDMPCRIVYDISVGKPHVYKNFSETFITRQCGVKFGRLSKEEAARLDYFLENCTDQAFVQ
ncbi:MAG: PilZ domain-containing protein [Desulfobacteraceae bacterium]|nr:PilZ domain-containing protein [Desulfobacteraceae bacterium]